jgi:hypothetical protein
MREKLVRGSDATRLILECVARACARTATLEIDDGAWTARVDAIFAEEQARFLAELEAVSVEGSA